VIRARDDAQRQVTDYVAQVRSYMGAFGASRGLLVFLTTGEVREVTA
jgi:hypothetical protein